MPCVAVVRPRVAAVSAAFDRHRRDSHHPRTSSHGVSVRPWRMDRRNTWRPARARCAVHGSVRWESGASGGSGPGALCVNMYVFAGVTTHVSANKHAAHVGVNHDASAGGVAPNGKLPNINPNPPVISATPVHST